MTDGASLERYFAACSVGDVKLLRSLLRDDPALARARHPSGRTGLHLAVRHPAALRILLARGADPNVRESGDNALPLHGAAAGGLVKSVRVLLDGGSDVQGVGDDHRMDVIGWACIFGPTHRKVVDLLLSRGARHNVFSAIAVGDVKALRRLVKKDPAAIRRRLSKNEQEQTALHYVVAPADGLVGGMFRTGDHYRTLDALIALGAELDARDAKGRTPLEVAMLRGDAEAMRRLHAAGAKLPKLPAADARATLPSLTSTIRTIAPMVGVPDVSATVSWYLSIGFELQGSHEEDGVMGWASVRLGDAEVMFIPAAEPWHKPTAALSLWIHTDRLDEIYARLKRRQLEHGRAVLTGKTPGAPEVPFKGDLYAAFYGQREFGIRDPNGVELMFCQPVTRG